MSRLRPVALNAVTNKVVGIVRGMAILGEFVPDEPGLAAVRVAGFVTILIGTVVLARFGGEEMAEELETAGVVAAGSE